MNTELVRAVFDCGIDDLRLLDDAECDMYAVIPSWIDPEKFKILERTVAEIAGDWKEAEDE